ncbi:MAG: DUF2786 domain-containing protein [Halobacteriovoraceae bacterium]|nr:DUF2786 domain-containing protein [Halobacteriovoraceae bacterium]
MAHQIMKDEMGLSVRRSRFVWRGYLYPLHFVVFDDPKKLGYFDCNNFQIGLHKKLMFLAKDDVIKDILRHELAHFYNFLLHRDSFPVLDAHGVEYQEVCKSFHWGQNVFRAYSNLEQDNLVAPINKDFDRLKERIEKLMALSDSDNPHEAERATIKANEYLLKYNIQNLDSSQKEEITETVVLSVLQEKRLNATLNSLYDILGYFYVQPVINRNRDGVSLDVVGSRLNVEIADYVAKFLKNEFERLWKTNQKKDPRLKGIKKKNSYFVGLSRGFCTKLKVEKDRVIAPTHGNELIALEGQLKERVKLAFPRLSRQQSSQASLDHQALQKGHNDGLSLNVRKGVSQGNKGNLITHQS